MPMSDSGSTAAATQEVIEAMCPVCKTKRATHEFKGKRLINYHTATPEDEEYCKGSDEQCTTA